LGVPVQDEGNHAGVRLPSNVEVEVSEVPSPPQVCKGREFG
jgi:hypothetical protein